MEADGGDHEAHILGVLPPEDGDPADELAAVGLVHHGNEAVAELHLHRLHGQQGIHIVDVPVVIRLAGGGQLR